MNIAALLRAADYLERREREAEHGYASTIIPSSNDYDRRRPKSKKAQARSVHNELEKNRRAHLRTCLERLKQIVPLSPQYSRHTTLGLLTKAKSFIKNLEEKDKKHQGQIEQLLREQRFLRRKLDQLNGAGPFHFERKRRSISECSSTTPSTSSTSETDEVDIMGYNSNSNSSQSDTDDHSSVQSTTSDGGVSVFTKRLNLGDDRPV